MKILLLSPYPPFPPHGGGTMRIYQLARGLATRHDITCLSFAADAAAERALAPMQRICRVVTVRGPAHRPLGQRAWTTLASPLPDMALRNAAPAYERSLRALLATETFEIVQAESIEMAGYLLSVQQYSTSRPTLVLDQFNAEYVLQKRAALTSLRAAANFGDSRSPLTRLQQVAGGGYSFAQWHKLARYEARVMRACDLVLAVADEDRAILQALAPKAQIGVVPNGVDTSSFNRVTMRAEQAGAIVFGQPTLVFSGTLDFRPNIDAVTWFVHEVLPKVRARRPNVRFLVVGKRPAPALEALAAANEIVLTGEVADARPYIAGATVYIVPMRIGGGVRLKLLEALSLEAPIVSTIMGAEGVTGLHHAEQCLLADTPDAFAQAVLQLIENPTLGRRLGEAGRALVAQHYDWDSIVPRLETLYESVQPSAAS